jgi:hypothetical protein
MAKKLPTRQGKYITAASRTDLIKSMTTSQEIYPLTALSRPLSIMKAMLKLERGFPLAILDKVSNGKCKVKWEGLVFWILRNLQGP